MKHSKKSNFHLFFLSFPFRRTQVHLCFCVLWAKITQKEDGVPLLVLVGSSISVMKEGEKRKKGKCVYFRTHRPTHQSLRPQAMANVVSLSLFLSFLFSFREFSQSQANFTLGTWRTRKEKSPDGRNAGGVTVAQEGALNGRRQQQS